MSFIIACNRNYYGENCSLACPLNCKTCRHTDGCSTCKAGWMGSNCTSGNNNSIFFHLKLYVIKIQTKKKTFEIFWSWKFSFIYFFHVKYISKEWLSFFLKHVYIYMERTVGTHVVYTVPTRLVTDLTEVAS